FFVEERRAASIADVPPERHRDRSSRRRLLRGVEEIARRAIEQHRALAKLILEERAETADRADEPAKCRAVEVVAPDFQPPAAVVADQLAIDQESLRKIHERVLLEIAGGVLRSIDDDVPELARRDRQGFQDMVADIRGERLPARALDD